MNDFGDLIDVLVFPSSLSDVDLYEVGVTYEFLENLKNTTEEDRFLSSSTAYSVKHSLRSSVLSIRFKLRGEAPIYVDT